MNDITIFEKALAKMPNKFSGVQFGKEARKFGATRSDINNHARIFLLQSCTLIGGYRSKTYIKGKPKQSEQVRNKLTLDDMAQILVNQGWKVRKPITDYIEIKPTENK